MSKNKYPPDFKARLALAALSGSREIAELSSESGVPGALIAAWAKQLEESAADIFSGPSKKEDGVQDKGARKAYPAIGSLSKEEREFLIELYKKN